MKVFFSWSGDRSRELATGLGTWLRQVIQAVEPWISTDIEKGARWHAQVAAKLQEAAAGIICVTPENVAEPWLLFEAGALSKSQDTRVCTLLLDLRSTDIGLPLSQFQATTLEKDEVVKLVNTLNGLLGAGARSEADLRESVELWWPRLDATITMIRSMKATAKAKRDPQETLEEVLAIVRRLDARADTGDELRAAILHLSRRVRRRAYRPITKELLQSIEDRIDPDRQGSLAKALTDLAEETKIARTEVFGGLAQASETQGSTPRTRGKE